MKRTTAVSLYLLLAVFAAISMTYYIAGALALRQEFFHASRYAQMPFDFQDDGQTLTGLRKEATAAGLVNGDVLLSINSAAFTGYAQFHDLFQHIHSGETIEVSVRSPSGALRQARIRIAPLEGPEFSASQYVTFLAPVLVVPLLGLIVGYWVVAARPRDLNAWLVLVLLAFPETAYGNLDWKFWPAPWYLLLGLWNSIIQVFVSPALLWFGFLFPERWRFDRRLPWFKYVILAAACFDFVLELRVIPAQFFSVQALQPLLPLQVWINRVEAWLWAICIVLFLVAIVDKLRSASTADARRRMRALAIGSCLSLGPLLFIYSVVPLFGINPHFGNWFSIAALFLAIFPLTLAYVLIVQRAMDLRILLRMGTRYLLARATFLTVEIAIVAFVLLRFVVPMLQRTQHPALNFMVLAACIGTVFPIFILRGSLSQQLQRWLDRKFFREAYNSELVLSDLSNQVRQLTDSSLVIDTVLARISEVLHVSQVAILLRGGTVFHLQQALGIDGGAVAFPDTSATVQNLLRTNQPATVYRDRPEKWLEDADDEEKALLRQINAELLLPMPGRARLIGMMTLGPKKSEEPYTPTDMRTLQSVAAQTGLTLEVAELAKTLAEESAHRERMNREVEIAREVQQRLFPQNIPEIDGVSLAGRCRPASEVGGDYYDLIQLEGGKLGLAIGDVSGKGISAALIMASLRASLRGLVLDDPGNLAKMMQKVNRLVYEASTSSRYATFFFAAFDPHTRELRYVNAGHNPPVLVKGASSGELQRLEASGPVVGLLPFVDYEEQSVILQPGDLLIAYTDGISEAMTADDEEWGEGRMLQAVPQCSDASAAEAIDALFHAADTFTAGAEQHDDMTLLIMKLAQK